MKAFVSLVLALAIGLSSPALAEGLNIGKKKGDRRSLLRSQMAMLDGRLSSQYENSARLKPGAKSGDEGAEGDTNPAPRYRGKYRGEYLEVARAAARRHGVPEEMFLRLVQQESGWNPYAVSHKGATGLAQLMPGTASHLGVDASDPHQNLDGGARYLKMMYDRFGSWRLALAAYNAGPNAVEEAGGIPPFAETKNYVKAILG